MKDTETVNARNIIRRRKIPRGLAAVCAAVMIAAPTFTAPRAQEMIFSSEASARGRREHVVQVNRWGRYSIEVKSAEGAALEVADKLRGVFARGGNAGSEDGRIDVFLEAGAYKIITEGPLDARGKLNLTVAGFQFINPAAGVSADSPINPPAAAPAPTGRSAASRVDRKNANRGKPAQTQPDVVDSAVNTARKNDYEYLKPFEQAAAELGDMEARGWWIFVPRDTVVYIEAMGRRLGGLAVFRGGELLVAEAGQNKEEGESRFLNAGVPEKTLNGLRVAKRLERGKHLIAAYGGGKDNFTVSDGNSPLYIQWMLDPIKPGRQINAKVNASGINRYAAPVSGVEYIAIENLEKENLSVEYENVKPENLDKISGRAFTIRPTDAMEKIRLNENSKHGILSISGKPGSAFRITPIDNMYERRAFGLSDGDEDGIFQLSTLHTGFAEDNIGASGVLVELREESIVALQADTVSAARVLRRKFNLLAGITSYLWVGDAGTYTFRPSGEAVCEWRVKRFFVTAPRDYAAPRWTRGESEITLNKGLHVIEIEPVKKGRAEFTIAGKSAAKGGEGGKFENPRPSVTFKPLHLKKKGLYRFYLNSQNPELSSTRVDTILTKDDVAVITGEAAGREEADASPVSELKIGIQQYTGMNKKGSKTYQFTISEAGIYKMETTGRLHTKLTLRDRFNGFTRTQSGNGAGRNALVAEYLLPGRYLLIAECENESAGRMGIILNKGDLLAGGRLQDGVDRRAAVKAFGAAVYDFTAQKGRYRFESFDLSGPMRVRLEDSDGWPLFEHGAAAPREVDLEKGAYKFYSLPIEYETYRVTRARQVTEKQPEAVGFGLHVIRVNEPVSARWVYDSQSSTAAANRAPPARFIFETPAQMEAKITLSPDFQGLLKPQMSLSSSAQYRDTVLAKINGVYSGVLEKGKYEITVSPIREMNHAPYELSITTTDLLAGINYDIDTLRDMRVQTGESGVYEIFSQGKREISARLYKEDKKTEVTRSGGNNQDWNFVISERLEAGKYFLRLTAGEQKVLSRRNFMTNDESNILSTGIFMRRVEDTLMQTIKIDGPDIVSKKISAIGKLAVIPIECSYGDILILNAKSESNIICELEAPQKSSTVIMGRRQGKEIKMSAPIDRKNKYTLKIWSEDRTNSGITLEIKTVEALPLAFKKALSGVTGTAAEENENTVFYKISGVPAGPAHYELIATQNDISSAAGVNGADKIFEEEDGSLIPSAGKQLWIEAAFQSDEHYRFIISPVLIADVKEISEKNKRKFETSDKYRFSKNRIKYLEREELPVTVKPNREKIFEIDAPARNFGLITFSMTQGRPAAGLSAPEHSADFVRNGIPVLGGQYFDGGVCLTAVIPGDTGRIIGWNALAGGPVDGISGSFIMNNYTLEKTDTLRTGRTAWKAEPARAKEYVVPPNRRYSIAVKLSPRTGLLHVPRDGRRNMYYGGEDGASHTIEPDGGKLFLFGNTGNGASGGTGNIELETYAAQASNDNRVQPQELSAGMEIVRQFSVDTREIIRVKNEVMAYRKLFTSGAVENVEWINRSGRITTGIKDEAELSGESGILLVNYASGWGKLRLCKDDGSQLALNECRWGGGVKKDGAPVIKEMSRLTMADGINWYSIELSEPAHVSLNAPIPAAAIISVDGKVRDYEEFWEELSWDIPLAQGKFTIGIKPMAGKASAGIPLTIGFYPVAILTENEPLDMYLMAGQKRIVKFDIPKKSKIGVGLSMTGETAEAVLLDRRGKNISKGKQIFTELDKGTYYVLLSTTPAKSASNGTGVKLYLFGQNNPSVNPPQDLVRWIIGGGAGKRPAGAPVRLDEEDDSSFDE